MKSLVELRHVTAVAVVVAALLSPTAQGAPSPQPAAAPTQQHQQQPQRRDSAAFAAPAPTPLPDLDRRALKESVKSHVEGFASDVGSRASGFLGSGVLNFPTGFPVGSDVEKSAGVSRTDLDAKPTQVLNLPAYGNWTSQGWRVRVHGNVYKVPNISQSKLDHLANAFLVGTDIDDLSESEQEQARNLTRSIFVVQQSDENVTMEFVPDATVKRNASGGAIQAAGGRQTITLPYETTREGDFDTLVTLRNTTGPNGGHLANGNETSHIQTLNMYAKGTSTGNATAYLVPPEGITVVSDIDDILRVTKIYRPKEGLLNTFAKPFTSWMNMASIYANWSSSLDNMHFHYLTTTPEQITRNYMDFILRNYPPGSFDTRPLNFSDVSATLHVRRYLLDLVFQAFPRRRFILLADTTNSDVMKDYPAMYKDYPGQVLCILLRNTSATDPGNHLPYDTSGFEGVKKEHYMFFNVPDDLVGLDVAKGHCVNGSVAQHVTFKKQGLPLKGDGSSGEDSAGSRAGVPFYLAAAVALLVGVVANLA